MLCWHEPEVGLSRDVVPPVVRVGGQKELVRCGAHHQLWKVHPLPVTWSDYYRITIRHAWCFNNPQPSTSEKSLQGFKLNRVITWCTVQVPTYCKDRLNPTMPEFRCYQAVPSGLYSNNPNSSKASRRKIGRYDARSGTCNVHVIINRNDNVQWSCIPTILSVWNVFPIQHRL